MPLMCATRIGPYELVTLIGAGGMGEVYKARDTRLNRDVALKILPESFAADAARLHRFEQEARILATLNHPNIVAIHDVGTFEGKPYLVSEFLEGRTLRERLEDGPLPARKAVEYATEIAHGLAAAHEKGIVHRDLKPENLFITSGGHIKILDFGLARVHPAAVKGVVAGSETTAADTQPGLVMGTAGYMSPEQVRGKPVDFRSDIFSFGSVFYEMVSGTRAFHRNSSVETMNAIINEEPVDILIVRPNVPPAVDRILRHCLEKEPEHRFQSARDLAFDLSSLTDVSDTSGRPAVAGLRKFRSKLLAAAGLSCVLAMVAALILWPSKPLRFEQLTFRRGYVYNARFAPSGNVVVYSAAWSGGPSEVFSASLDNKDSRPLGLRDADLLAVSSRGELAILLKPRVVMNGFLHTGTLATVNMSGGTAPRELADRVQAADWAPDGRSLAVVRTDGVESWIEYPVGKEIYRPARPGWLSDLRLSQSGERIAVLEHPASADDRGQLLVLDATGAINFRSNYWAGVFGLAWRSGDQLIVSAIPANEGGRQMITVNTDGRSRRLQELPAEVTVHDVAPDRRILFAENERNIIIRFRGTDGVIRDLSWLDRSILDVITPDGSSILFHEGGLGGGALGSTYIRATDGSPAVKLADGYGIDLSPDRKWILVFIPTVPVTYRLVPTGPGEAKTIPTPSINQAAPLGFSRDGKGLVWVGVGDNNRVQTFQTALDGSDLRASSPPAPRPLLVSANGQFEVRDGEKGRILWSYERNAGSLLPSLGSGDILLALTDDGQTIFVGRVQQATKLLVVRINTKTNSTETTMEIPIEDLTGIMGINRILTTPDGRILVYSYVRHLSQLFVTSSLR